jgi:hypothetical protein
VLSLGSSVDIATLVSAVSEITNERAIARVRAWIERFVVDLNLCPFARPVVSTDALRIVACESASPEAIATLLITEFDLLSQSSESDIATSLLVFPEGLEDFDDYLGFLDDAQTLLEEMGLGGEIQIASFHPDYRFEGEPVDAVSHFTNRAPYPLIHLLRETLVTNALDAYPNPERIPERNIQTLERLGLAGIESLLNSLDR